MRSSASEMLSNPELLLSGEAAKLRQPSPGGCPQVGCSVQQKGRSAQPARWGSAALGGTNMRMRSSMRPALWTIVALSWHLTPQGVAAQTPGDSAVVAAVLTGLRSAVSAVRGERVHVIGLAVSAQSNSVVPASLQEWALRAGHVDLLCPIPPGASEECSDRRPLTLVELAQPSIAGSVATAHVVLRGQQRRQRPHGGAVGFHAELLVLLERGSDGWRVVGQQVLGIT